MSEAKWPLGLPVQDAAFVVACAACGVVPENASTTVSGLKIDPQDRAAVARRMADIEYLMGLGPECRKLVEQLALWLMHGHDGSMAGSGWDDPGAAWVALARQIAEESE